MYNIIASPLANSTYLQNIEFLEQRWTTKEAKNFIQKVADIVAILKVSPLTFQRWENDKTVHKIEIVKQITLYYQITENNVELLIFWNNLQDPTKLKHLIKIKKN